MKYIKYITILFFVIVLFFANNSSVLAQQTCSANTGSGNWSLCDTDPESGLPTNCISTGGGGSQEAYECCLSAGTSTCQAPTGCECGMKADGSGCKSCGGGYTYPTCGAGQELKCGNDPAIYDPNSTHARCSFRKDCGETYFPSRFTEAGCDGQEEKGTCQINCKCCAPTDNLTKSTTQGSTYTKTNGCYQSGCDDWDDIYVSHITPQIWANRCELIEGGDYNYWTYKNVTTCISATTTWNCVSSTPTCTVDVNPQTIGAGSAVLFPASIPTSSGYHYPSKFYLI